MLVSSNHQNYLIMTHEICVNSLEDCRACCEEAYIVVFDMISELLSWPKAGTKVL